MNDIIPFLAETYDQHVNQDLVPLPSFLVAKNTHDDYQKMLKERLEEINNKKNVKNA